MASTTNDRWLWLGLGVFLVLAVKGVAYGLKDIEHLTEINKPQKPKPRQVQRAAEDNIKIESLQTLATSNSIEISKAATKILVDRFINDRLARAILHADLNSADEEVSSRARVAVRLIDQTVGSNIWRYSTRDARRSSQSFSSVPLLQTQSGGAAGTRSRPLHEESTEEQAMRRRRREAMVLNEGDRPVSQDDIIQSDEGRMTEAEARVVEQALEDRSRAERR